MAHQLTRELELAIDEVAESYRSPLEINNLESAALPNRRAVIEAFNLLTPVIYMGFYSTRALNRDNLRHSVGEHVYPAHEILVEQISRAVTYEERAGRAKHERHSGWSEEVVLRLLHNLPSLRRILNADVLAAYEGDPAAKSIEEVVFSYPTIRAITAYRLAHELYLEDVPMIPRIISEYAHSESGIDLHAGASIGERLFIDHGTGVVIGETSVIGRNVKIYQGVTLGAHSTRRHQTGPDGEPARRHPTIEDNVTLYSGATILGGDTVIGEGSVIGGNVFLTRSVPAGTKIMIQAT